MAQGSVQLLPQPRLLKYKSGFLPIDGPFRIVAATDVSQSVLNAARRLKGNCSDVSSVTLTISLEAGIAPAQGYRLEISSKGIVAKAHDCAGAFYAVQTLSQLLTQHPQRLPNLVIEDWPDFPARGVMLDISRDKVPTMATLFALIDMLGSWKINQFQLYTEHTFAYRGHETVWHQASPMTADEILALDEYCRQRFVELVPNQNSFGHMDRWLKHEKYRGLAEAPDGFMSPWGARSEAFSLCPRDPRSIELVRELYDELLPNFSSRLFNVGCDETWDVGQGRSKEAVEKLGATRVYLDYLHQIHRLCQERGRTMMFWGDIIMKQPELIAELPQPIIALEWGYEANHPFDHDGRAFAQSGIPFYVCPGTSSWNSIAGRTDNALGNLRSAAENGTKHGAIGYLITDWGDNGHLQYLPVSYLGYAAGAAFSWCLASNADNDWPAMLDRFAFDDSAGALGRVAFDLGNVYQSCGKLMSNNSALFHTLLWSGKKLDDLTVEGLDAADRAIESAMAPLSRQRSGRADAALMQTELENAAEMLRCGVALARQSLGKVPGADELKSLQAKLGQVIETHRRLWLARNRAGGLVDSVARLENSLRQIQG